CKPESRDHNFGSAPGIGPRTRSRVRRSVGERLETRAAPRPPLRSSLPWGGCLRILVAGGAGLIGSHLCERLLQLGHEVICADNLSTGRLENLVRILGNRFF